MKMLYNLAIEITYSTCLLSCTYVLVVYHAVALHGYYFKCICCIIRMVFTYVRSCSLTCVAPVLYSTVISPITAASRGVPPALAGLVCFGAINSCTKVAVSVSSNFTYSTTSEKSFQEMVNDREPQYKSLSKSFINFQE